MKAYFKLFFIAAAFSFALTGCEEVEKEPVYKGGGTASTILTPSAGSSIVLQKASGGDTLGAFSWSEADYGPVLPRDYLLEVDYTSGDFSNAVSIVSTKEITYLFTQAALMRKLIDLGINTSDEIELAFRITSSANNEAVDSIHSEVVEVLVTPYVVNTPTIRNPANNSSFDLVKDTTGEVKFEKFIWDEVDYGDNEVVIYSLEFDSTGQEFDNPTTFYRGAEAFYQPTVSRLNSAIISHFSFVDSTTVPVELDFRVIASVGGVGLLQSGIVSYYIEPYSQIPEPTNNWAVVGSATPNGWGDPDIDMDWDYITDVWTVTTDLVAGEIKFRANNAWTINLGGVAGEGNILTQDGPNIPISASGTYLIKLYQPEGTAPYCTIELQ